MAQAAIRFDTPAVDQVEAFIERWQGREGGQERANYALFLTELCDVLDVAHPDPAGATHAGNEYVYERTVRVSAADGSSSNGRIDLYKKGSFVLEAKQSRLKGAKKELSGQTDLFMPDDHPDRGRRSAHRAWDVLMLNARRQAEAYARALPTSDGWPPFILVCDVGHCIEVYADFSGQGKNYTQFPDRQNFRIYIEDLRDAEHRARLKCIWDNPTSLDPTKRSARVTRQVAVSLAAISRSLEKRYTADEVAQFLMRCLFTMFAEDVELLPKTSFKDLLAKCEADISKFEPFLSQMWEAMDIGGFAYAIEKKVRRFNGEFFKRREVLQLNAPEISELRKAAEADWREVEPAIFGTLLEQALLPYERAKLGAHYTPRSYVERLVSATIMEPLRHDWAAVLSTAERQKAENRTEAAIETVKRFYDNLCSTRILDPACGTGNFLYVALEMLKRLEGEILEALNDIGGQEAFAGLEGHTVDPHQFLGLELNPRAAAIAELVLWIGYLQWHLRNRGAPPSDPILKAFRNIQGSFNAVLNADWEPARDASGTPIVENKSGGVANLVSVLKSARRPSWPPAEFIVGNPPFMGGKDLRSRLGDAEAEALWAAHPHMNESADFVMYWWDHAAELLTAKGTVLRRFGFVTTNSISQVFQRKIMERHLKSKTPISVVMAIPNHPWTKATKDAAAVRIAMTVAEAGTKEGILGEVISEEGLDTDQPVVELQERTGIINSDLTVGVDVTTAISLHANEGLCSPGVKLHGSGFIVSVEKAAELGLGRRPELEQYIRPYRNGRDLTSKSRDAMVIDLFKLTAEEVRSRFPEVYQHVLTSVKPERDTNNREAYRTNWWVFGEPRRELRPALDKLNRYIVTVETMRHRIFQFLDERIVPDNKLVTIATDDAFHLGILSSRVHVVWATRTGGWLGVGNDSVYVKSRCFDSFPFPAATPAQTECIRRAAEALDAHRKERQALYPSVSLTDAYNILAKVRAGVKAETLDAKDRAIFDAALILVLRELHDELDAAVATAYGWPVNLLDEEILRRISLLNAERVAEERAGLIRHLRPTFQQSGTAAPTAKEVQIEANLPAATRKADKPAFRAGDIDQTIAVIGMLNGLPGSIDAASIASGFKQGKKIELKIGAVLQALERTSFITLTDDGWLYQGHRAA